MCCRSVGRFFCGRVRCNKETDQEAKEALGGSRSSPEKITLSETVFRAFSIWGCMTWKQAAKSELENVDIQTVELQIKLFFLFLFFFCAESTLRMYFKVLENNVAIKNNKNRNKVENPYYSLGLLPQTMIIIGTDHHDLSVICQIKLKPAKSLVNRKEWTWATRKGGVRVHPSHPPPSLLACGLFWVNLVQKVWSKMINRA